MTSLLLFVVQLGQLLLAQSVVVVVIAVVAVDAIGRFGSFTRRRFRRGCPIHIRRLQQGEAHGTQRPGGQGSVGVVGRRGEGAAFVVRSDAATVVAAMLVVAIATAATLAIAATQHLLQFQKGGRLFLLLSGRHDDN